MLEPSTVVSPASSTKVVASANGIHRLRTFVSPGQLTSVPQTWSPITVTSHNSSRPCARTRIVR